MEDDPYRMYLVVRRGAFGNLETGCVLAGAAAVAAVRRFADDPERAPAVAAWRRRPGKVTLRARGGQWDEVLRTEDFSAAGDLDGAAVLALPPIRRSERSELVARRLQAMASELEPLPAVAPGDVAPVANAMTYVVNPAITMSTGKTMAQVAHAATTAAGTGRCEDWIAAGCPARAVTLAGDEEDERVAAAAFRALCARDDLAARVEDAGLTEVPPGTITVVALPSART